MAEIQDILKQFNDLRRVAPEPQRKAIDSIQTELTGFAQQQQDERNRLLAENSQHLTTIAQLQQANTALQRTVAEQARLIDEFKGRSGTEAPPTSATPANLVQSFKSVMDSIQAEAQTTPGIATTIKGMDLEIKGLVQVQQEREGPVQTLMVLPNVGRAVQPETLSTLRVSFGAIPVVAPAAAAPQRTASPAAPPPPSTPAPSAPPMAAKPPHPRGRTRRAARKSK